MTCIEKQIVLHGLHLREFYLPRDVIRVIKEFAFMDTESCAKKRKITIMRLISNTVWCGRTRPRDEIDGKAVLWIEGDVRCPQFAMDFCKKCGNYSMPFTNYPDEGRVHKVLCKCVDW
jgi:hypothetical protein